MANSQIQRPTFALTSCIFEYESSSDEEKREEKYKSGVFRIDAPEFYDYVMITSSHIGCLNENQYEDLETISKEEFTLLYVYDALIPDKLRFFAEADDPMFESIHTSLLSHRRRWDTYAMIIVNNEESFTICQFMSIIEKAWGENSRNNLSFISADRVVEEYYLKIREGRRIVNKILVISLGDKFLE